MKKWFLLPEKKKKRGGHGLTIVMLLMGVVILIAIILVAGKASGLIGSNNDTDKKTEASDTSESDDDGMVTVPNLVGKTEDEAKNITKDMKLGIQPMGEEASNQAKGTISSQSLLCVYSGLSIHIRNCDLLRTADSGRYGINC